MDTNMKGRIIASVTVLMIYSLIYIIEENVPYTYVLPYTYVYDWTNDRIVFFAIIPLLFAVVNKPIAAIISTVGYPVGIALGEFIGYPLYLADVQRHDLMAQQPDYVQNSMPHHYGWLICIVVYFLAIAAGVII